MSVRKGDDVSNDSKVVEGELPVGLKLRESDTSGLHAVEDGGTHIDFVRFSELHVLVFIWQSQKSSLLSDISHNFPASNDFSLGKGNLLCELDGARISADWNTLRNKTR